MEDVTVNSSSMLNMSDVQKSSTPIEIEDLHSVLSPAEQTFLVSLYSISSFLILIGNTLVILVELYGRRSARNLRKFLINLAISDIIYGVLSVPFNYTNFILGRWLFPLWMCKGSQFAQTLSLCVTTYTLTFIGIERYFATLHPLSRANRWLRSHCNLVLLMGWALGAILSIYPTWNTSVVSSDRYECRHWQMRNDLYLLVSFFITFILPLILMTYSYGAIGRRLLETQRNWSSFSQMSMSVSANAMSSSNGIHPSGHGNEQSAPSLSSDNTSNPFVGLFNRCDSHKTSTANTVVAAASVAAAAAAAAAVADSHVNTAEQRNHKARRTPKMSLTSNQSVDSTITLPNVNTTKMTTVKIYCNEYDAKQPTNCGSIDSNTNKVVSSTHRRNTEILHTMRVFRLLVAVLIFFIICWMPVKVHYIYIELFLTDKESGLLLIRGQYLPHYVWGYLLVHLLAVSNSFINPIIYSFMSKSFRADLVDLFVFVLEKLNVRTKQSVKRTAKPQIELLCRRGRHANMRNNCYCIHRHNFRNNHNHQHFTFNRNIPATVSLQQPVSPNAEQQSNDQPNGNSNIQQDNDDVASYSEMMNSKNDTRSLQPRSSSYVSQSESHSPRSSVFSC